VAEKAGKHVALLAVAGTNPLMAIVQTAIKLKSARIVLNYSPRFRNAGEQARTVEKQWERLPAPRFPLALEIVFEDSTNSQYCIFGQHPTQLWPEDVERIHKLWLKISEKEPGAEIRHRDVVSVALYRLDKDFHSDQGSKILNEIRREALEQKHAVHSGCEHSED
jgi:hypothetical protein